MTRRAPRLLFAGGSRGPRARADGKGGTLARGWYVYHADGSRSGPMGKREARDVYRAALEPRVVRSGAVWRVESATGEPLFQSRDRDKAESMLPVYRDIARKAEAEESAAHDALELRYMRGWIGLAEYRRETVALHDRFDARERRAD